MKNKKKKKQKKISDAPTPAPEKKCERCGETFKQIWFPKAKKWSEFKDCPRCRAKKAHAPKPVPVVDYTDKRVMPYTPHKGKDGKGGQDLIHLSPKKYKLLRAGARFGKDVCCVAEFVLKFIEMLSEDYRDKDLLTPRVHGWIIAPQLSLTDQNWRYFMEFFPEDWIVDRNKAEKKIYTENDGLIEFKSTTNPDSLVSVGLDLLLWTEIDQSENPDKMIEAWANLFTRLQSPGRGPEGKGGLFLGNSTPKGRGILYSIEEQAINDPDNWEVFHFTTMDSPFITEEAFRNAKKSMPERLFRQIWLAEYPNDSGGLFTNLDKVCVGVEQPPVQGMMYKAAWDPARKVDYSAFGIRNSMGDMVYKTRWTGMPWTIQLDHISSLCRQYNNCPLDIDVTGGGATLPEAAAERGLVVNPISFTNEKKAEMVSKLSLLCEQASIRLIADVSEELRFYRAETLPSGRIRYSAPKGKHDDQVDLCLMLYHDFNDPVTTVPFMGTFLGAKRRAV